MIILTDTDGEEHLIPDRELLGLFTELRDLIQQQRNEAIETERQRFFAIVESHLEEADVIYDPPSAIELLRKIKEEIRPK